MSGLNAVIAAPLLTAGISLYFAGITRRQRSFQRLHIFWALFAVSIFCFSLSIAVGDQRGGLTLILGVLSSSSCGLSWLLARALFRPSSRETWPYIVVGVLFVASSALEALSWTGFAGEPSAPIWGMAAEARMLTGSTALLLALIEALNGLNARLPKAERWFRLSFATGYSALVAFSIFWANNTTASISPDMIKVTCAVIALFGATWAVAYRSANPLLQAATPKQRGKLRTVTVEEQQLGQRVIALLQEHEVYTQAEIKVSNVAQRLAVPDYKVSQSITGALGFRNFNRLVNHFRVRRARELLSDPDFDDHSILSIALDCGFASIGPFNRAFKQEVGLTPGQYRSARDDQSVLAYQQAE